MTILSKSLLYIMLLIIPMQFVHQSPVFAESIPDDSIRQDPVSEKNTPMFWIWDENLELLQGSADPDTQIIYLASLTKAYTLNVFFRKFSV